jgi:hypothetical protein
MPKADILNITSATRRSVLGFGVAAAFAGPATITKLIAPSILSLCAAFDALQLSKAPLFDMPDGYEREFALDAVELKQEPMVERMSELQATSMDEHRARARSISLYLGRDQLAKDAESYLWPERMVAALLRDLAPV